MKHPGIKLKHTATALLMALSLLVPAGDGLAQAVIKVDPSTKEKPDEASPPKPEIRSLPPAYDDVMMRLAEMLGALHYLRELCGAKEGSLWRDQMQELIEKEEPDETRARALVQLVIADRGHHPVAGNVLHRDFAASGQDEGPWRLIAGAEERRCQ